MAVDLIPYVKRLAKPTSLTPKNRPGYFLSYYAAAVPGLLNRHRFEIQAKIPYYQTQFSLSERQKQNWIDLFGVEDGTRQFPFTYWSAVGNLAMMRVLIDLGANFRHVVHLKSRIVFRETARLCQGDEPFTLSTVLKDVFPLGSGKVAVIIESQICGISQACLAVYNDVFIINHVHPAAETAVKNHPHFGFHDAKKWTQPPQPQYPSPRRNCTSIEIPENAGAVYGKLTGDYHLIFTKGFHTRSFRYPNPFVPGMFLTNHVLKAFTSAHCKPPRQLDIHFIHPTYTGQTIELVYGRSEFALCDAECRTLAIGYCQV